MPIPTELKLHRQSNLLDIAFDDGTKFSLSSEFLRVHSPSAEVKGHGPGQEVLQLNKQTVAINNIEAIGNYAVRFVFSDGHNSGLYTWDYLYELATQQGSLWQQYLQKLADAGHSYESASAHETKTVSVGLYKP